MDKLTVYKKTRELFEDPTRHTINYLARDARNQPVDCDSPAAVSFCLWGGLAYVSGKDHMVVWELLPDLHQVSKTLYGIDAIDANNTLGRGAVNNILDTAIAKLEPKPEPIPRDHALVVILNQRAA